MNVAGNMTPPATAAESSRAADQTSMTPRQLVDVVASSHASSCPSPWRRVAREHSPRWARAASASAATRAGATGPRRRTAPAVSAGACEARRSTSTTASRAWCPGEWDEFKAALKRPLGIAFRIIGRADDPGAVALRASMEREFVGQMKRLEVDGGACRRRSRSAGTGAAGVALQRLARGAARQGRGAQGRRRRGGRRRHGRGGGGRRRRRRGGGGGSRRRWRRGGRRRGRGAGRRRGGRRGDARRLPPLADGGGGGGQHLAAGGGVDGAATRPRRAPGPPRARHVHERGRRRSSSSRASRRRWSTPPPPRAAS